MFERVKINEKEAGFGPFNKSIQFSMFCSYKKMFAKVLFISVYFCAKGLAMTSESIILK